MPPQSITRVMQQLDSKIWPCVVSYGIGMVRRSCYMALKGVVAKPGNGRTEAKVETTHMLSYGLLDIRKPDALA